jgi:hypothetical protein
MGPTKAPLHFFLLRPPCFGFLLFDPACVALILRWLTNGGVAAAAEWEQELQAELSDFEMVAGDEAAANWETEADQLLQQ